MQRNHLVAHGGELEGEVVLRDQRVPPASGSVAYEERSLVHADQLLEPLPGPYAHVIDCFVSSPGAHKDAAVGRR